MSQQLTELHLVFTGFAIPSAFADLDIHHILAAQRSVFQPQKRAIVDHDQAIELRNVFPQSFFSLRTELREQFDLTRLVVAERVAIEQTRVELFLAFATFVAGHQFQNVPSGRFKADTR